jgi:hypothetical protein
VPLWFIEETTVVEGVGLEVSDVVEVCGVAGGSGVGGLRVLDFAGIVIFSTYCKDA